MSIIVVAVTADCSYVLLWSSAIRQGLDRHRSFLYEVQVKASVHVV